MPCYLPCGVKATRAFWQRLRHSCDDALAQNCAFVLILGGGGSLADPMLLSADDRRRMACMRRQSDRDNLALGHTMIQHLAAPAAPSPPVPLLTGVRGKPYMAGARPFNLAHSGRYVACAICASNPIGIDIEVFEHIAPEPSLLTLIAHPAERHLIDAQPGEERMAQFQRCWTRKEALLKQQGLGLIDDLTTLDVQLDVASPLLQAHDPVRLHDLALPVSGLSAALALDSRIHAATLYFFDADSERKIDLPPA